MDRNEEKIRAARERHPDIELVHGDILDVPAEDAGYDCVVLSEVLEHVDEEVGGRMLEKAFALVAPRGRLIVSVPNEDCVPHPNHVRELSRRDVEALLRPFGHPVLVADQPFRYLVLYADRAE